MGNVGASVRKAVSHHDEHTLALEIHWHEKTLSLAADGFMRRFRHLLFPAEPPKQKRKPPQWYVERPCIKKRHKTANGARRHIRELVESGHATKGEMNFYRCKGCHCIHVGHVNEEAKARKDSKKKPQRRRDRRPENYL